MSMLLKEKTKAVVMLPKEKTKKKTKLEDQTILIFGPPKIGKSTFCSEMERPLFISTEPGLNALEVYSANIDSWEKFLNICQELQKNGHAYKSIIIDTVDNLFQFCQHYVLSEKNNVAHESDLGFGKGWALVRGEFTRVLKKLSMLNIGLVFISHVREKQIDSKTGKFSKAIASVEDKARDFLVGLCDLILYFDSEISHDKDGKPCEKRIIRCSPSKFWEAGGRWNLPDELPLNFKNFKKEYDKAAKNEQ